MDTSPVANPFDQFDTASANPFDQFGPSVQDQALHQQRLASAEAALANQAPPEPDAVTRYSSAAFRPIAQGVAAMPLAAMDAGVILRNLGERAVNAIRTPRLGELVSGKKPADQYVLPSEMFRQSLDANTLAPDSKVGKVAEGISSMVVGAALPGPELAKRPEPIPTVRQQTLSASQKEGYVVPPSTTNPSMVNKLLEGTAGKLTTAQQASGMNQATTNRLAAESLGLGPDAQITRDVLNNLRQEAGNAYRAVKEVGTITPDEQFALQLERIAAKYRGAARSFPDLASSPVEDAIKAVSQPSFEADSAVDAISILRDKAATAGKQGDKGLASAYRSIANALEGAIERHIQSDPENAGLLTKFRSARELIAKTYSVEKALNSETGNVSAVKLAQQLGRGAPLSGGLRKAASFGAAFPKAARSFEESMPGVSPLDAYGAGGLAAITGNPTPLLYPFGRMGTRNFLLSPAGQRLATQGPQRSLPPEVVNALAAGYVSAQ